MLLLMKKLLSIIILGLLLNGCSSTPVEIKNYKTECIKGDCVNGKGTKTFSNGGKYIGEFKDGNLHGYGIYKVFNGDEYIGEYNQNKKQGKGTYIWLDGDKYIGDWKNGKMSGKGIKIYKSQRFKYDGDFLDGKWHGYSTTTTKGVSCKGEYRNNERIGDILCLRSSDGVMAIGSLVNGENKWTRVATNKAYFNSNAFQNPKPRLYYDSLTGGMKECAYDQGMTGICSSFKPFNSNSYDKDTLFYNPSTGAMQNCAGVVSVNGKCSAYGIFNHSKATADKGQLYYDAKNKKMTTCLFVDLNGVCKHYELVPNSWANNYGGFRMTDPNNPYLKRIPQTSQDFLDLGMRMLSGGCTLGLDC